jgi:hypothetical protein
MPDTEIVLLVTLTQAHKKTGPLFLERLRHKNNSQSLFYAVSNVCDRALSIWLAMLWACL